MGYSKHSLPRLGRCCVPLRGDSNPPPVPPACKLWTTRPAARLRLFKISFYTYPDTVPATDQNNRPRRGGSVRPLCGSVRRLSGLPCLDIPRSFRGLCRGCAAAWRGGKRAKEKPPTAGRLCTLLIHFQKLRKENERESDDTENNQLFLTPLHESKPFRRGGFGEPISNGGGVLF